MNPTPTHTVHTGVGGRPVWTPDAVRNLGTTIDVETAAAILGIGRTKAYELAKSNEFPVPILRIGRHYRVPTPAILDLLGIT